MPPPDPVDPLAGRSPDEQLFLKFLYPEVKDLAKTFLTLILGSLVVSVSFAEKVVPFTSASHAQKNCLLGSWAFLVISLSMCGYGIYLIFLAAEKASGSLIYKYDSEFRDTTKQSYIFLDLSAVAFGIGVILMVGWCPRRIATLQGVFWSELRFRTRRWPEQAGLRPGKGTWLTEWPGKVGAEATILLGHHRWLLPPP